ncbi:MAG: hypothetical protein WCY30_07105 [Candidatus Neomarinimicrobiota bacterium]|jgi:hypothetical protein
MSNNTVFSVKPSEIWDGYGLKTIDDFKTNLPIVKFKKTVPDDVVKFFAIVQKLLIFSYYEYEFIDVAANRALMGFELAIRQRYFEITGKTTTKKDSLNQLIIWAQKNQLFEFDQSVDAVRRLRNYFAHPNQYSLAGITVINLAADIANTINEMYCDIDLRKVRKQTTITIDNELQTLVKTGAVLTMDHSEQVVFGSVLTCFDNLSELNTYYFQFWPVFNWDEKSDTITIPEPIRIKSHLYQFKENQITVTGATLKPITGHSKMEDFLQWKSKFDSNKMLKSEIEMQIGRETKRNEKWTDGKV